MSLNNDIMSPYTRAYERAVRELQNWYGEYADSMDEKALRDMLCESYKKKRLDPDGKFIRVMYGVDCTADALISIWRICQMEMNRKDIVPVYEHYRKKPMFYFPCEQGGINQTRSTVFGDRIDCTLFDLKIYFSEHSTEKCRLKRALDRPITQKWLQGIQTFENLIDAYDVRGIFTDDKYNVIDLETGRLLLNYPDPEVKLLDWSENYYGNVKAKIDEWYVRDGVE